MKRTVLRKRWASGESAGGQVVESELCTTAPGGLLSRDFHAVSFTEFHVDSRRRTAATRLLWRGRWELLADEDARLWERNEDLVREILWSSSAALPSPAGRLPRRCSRPRGGDGLLARKAQGEADR